MSNRTRFRIWPILGVTAMLAWGCAAPEGEEPETANFTLAEAQAEPHEWEKDGLRVSALTDSPRFAGASLAVEGLDGPVASGEVAFGFQVEGYELGAQTSDAGANGLANSAKGQHIHLILDNGPY